MYKRLRLTALMVLIAFISLPLVSLAHLGPGPHPHTHCSDCGAEAHMDPADCISNSSPEPETDRTIWESITNIAEAIGSEFVFGYSTGTAIDEELEAHGVYDSLTSWISSTADSFSDWFWDSADYYYDAYMDAWGY